MALRARIDGRRTRGAVAPAKDVCADDEKFICVERLSWANKFLPPALRRVEWSGSGMRGRGKACVQEDGIVLGRIESAPGLVGYVKGWERI